MWRLNLGNVSAEEFESSTRPIMILTEMMVGGRQVWVLEPASWSASSTKTVVSRKRDRTPPPKPKSKHASAQWETNADLAYATKSQQAYVDRMVPRVYAGIFKSNNKLPFPATHASVGAIVQSKTGAYWQARTRGAQVIWKSIQEHEMPPFEYTAQQSVTDEMGTTVVVDVAMLAGAQDDS